MCGCERIEAPDQVRGMKTHPLPAPKIALPQEGSLEPVGVFWAMASVDQLSKPVNITEIMIDDFMMAMPRGSQPLQNRCIVPT